MTKIELPDRAYWLTSQLAAFAAGVAAKVGHRPFPDQFAPRHEIGQWIIELSARIAPPVQDDVARMEMLTMAVADAGEEGNALQIIQDRTRGVRILIPGVVDLADGVDVRDALDQLRPDAGVVTSSSPEAGGTDASV